MDGQTSSISSRENAREGAPEDSSSRAPSDLGLALGLPQVPQQPCVPPPQDPSSSVYPPPQVPPREPLAPQQPPKDESLGAYPKVPQYSNVAPVAPTPPVFVPPPAPAGSLPNISTEQVLKAQKYCKYANSALTYEDVNTAVLNLHKALALLTTGVDPQ